MSKIFSLDSSETGYMFLSLLSRMTRNGRMPFMYYGIRFTISVGSILTETLLSWQPTIWKRVNGVNLYGCMKPNQGMTSLCIMEACMLFILPKTETTWRL